jgi:hypothetical protein
MAVTLAETKAERDDLKRAIARHKGECPQCGSTARGRARPKPCDRGRELAARHRETVQLIKTWFDPAADQGTLI